MLANSPGPLVAATVGPGQRPASNDFFLDQVPGPNMAATIGLQTGGLVVARSDQLWQLQMTTYGSQNWSRTICGCHNWSPRTVGEWDQFARDRPFKDHRKLASKLCVDNSRNGKHESE